jgi:hypothetical protein
MSRAKTAENKKKAPRVAAGPEAAPFARSLGENLGRLARTVLPITLILTTMFGLSLLLWLPLQSNAPVDLGVSERSRLTPQAIEQPVLRMRRPEWISKDDFEDLARQGLVAANHSVFEPNLSRTLMQCYKNNPWVEKVTAVHLQYPAQLSVELELRKPAARIERSTPDKGQMVVDRNGVVLNLMPDTVPIPTPLIVGLSCARTDIGKSVPEKEVQEGLKLLGVLDDTFAKLKSPLKVAEAKRDPKGTWYIVTDRGPALYWGYFCDDPPIDEPTTTDKLQKLALRLREIGDPSRLEYIRLYSPDAPVAMRSEFAAAKVNQTPPHSKK